MIVRIMGEGQFLVADDQLPALNQLDGELENAIAAEDAASFTATLAKLLGMVRAVGEKPADDDLQTSDLILPRADATLADVRELLTADGLIPGR